MLAYAYAENAYAYAENRDMTDTHADMAATHAAARLAAPLRAAGPTASLSLAETCADDDNALPVTTRMATASEAGAGAATAGPGGGRAVERGDGLGGPLACRRRRAVGRAATRRRRDQMPAVARA